MESLIVKNYYYQPNEKNYLWKEYLNLIEEKIELEKRKRDHYVDSSELCYNV